jgi:hypothetical protein
VKRNGSSSLSTSPSLPSQTDIRSELAGCAAVKWIRLIGVGEVTLEELEAMLFAYANAGAPKPILEANREERAAILQRVASRGDAQMRALVASILSEE